MQRLAQSRLIRDHQGKPSATRIPMIAFGSLLVLLWLAIGVIIVVTDYTWSDFEGWLDWGKEFAFGTMGVFVGGKIGDGLKAKREG